MKKILLLILLVYTGLCTSHEDTARVVALRAKEREAVFSSTQAFEHEIMAIKERHNISPVSYFYAPSVMPFLCWQLLFMCIWYLLYWALHTKKNVAFKLVLLLCVMLTGMPIIQSYYRMSEQWAITSLKTQVYIGPDTSYPVRAELDYLSDVRIIKKENMWYHIAFAAGRGWLPADAVVLIA